MNKLVTSFLGRDCPGVVAAVAGLLDDAHCTVLEVSQTILAGEFAAIFVIIAPDDVEPQSLHTHLQEGLKAASVDLSPTVRYAIEGAWNENTDCEPFVVTADGPNGIGLIAGMSRVFSRHSVNIENLKALLGEGSEGQALFVFEVMLPSSVNVRTLRRELREQGQKLSLRVSMQHRDIFEAVHRVQAM